MNAQSNVSNFGATGTKSSGPWLSLCETNWGYIISSDSQWSSRAALIERVCAVAGLACLAVAGLQWLFPPVTAGVLANDTVAFRIMSSMGMAMPALMFLWISDRGMGQEIQVDVNQGCLRQGVVNRNGKFRAQRTVKFADISSAYIKRVEGGDKAQLFVRMVGSDKVLNLASGREATLRALHQRLVNEMNPAPVPVEGWDRKGRRLSPKKAAVAG